MNIKDLKHKQVAILGYGQEGKAIVKYLMKHGVKPVLFDEKPLFKWAKKEQVAIKKLGIDFIFGNNCFKKLADFDVAFRSPGISKHNLSLTLPTLGEGNLQITSQTKWFFEHCPAKIIGVTGTKGKSTTASLIYEVLKENLNAPPHEEGIGEVIVDRSNKINYDPHQFPLARGRAYITGNIGKQQPFDFLDKLKPNDWVIFELSSFQLQDLKKSPHIAVVLMTTSEHLDYHRSAEEYVNAKEAIVKFQKADDFAIINADFGNSMKIGKISRGTKLYFSRKRSLKQGCFIENNNIVVKNIGFANFSACTCLRQEPMAGRQFPRLHLPSARADGGQAISNLQLKGEHNLENVCAATIVAALVGCQPKTIIKTIKRFRGLEHRLEFVRIKKGVKFYNDSISTIPETAIAAIESFNEPIILILGGSSKNADFTELGKTIRDSKNIKALILIGREAKNIKRAVNKALSLSPSPNGRGGKVRALEGAKSMATIFKQIKLVAKKGDVVLLSPACASFDMFKNYQDRGEQFKTAARLF